MTRRRASTARDDRAATRGRSTQPAASCPAPETMRAMGPALPAAPRAVPASAVQGAPRDPRSRASEARAKRSLDGGRECPRRRPTQPGTHPGRAARRDHGPEGPQNQCPRRGLRFNPRQSPPLLRGCNHPHGIASPGRPQCHQTLSISLGRESPAIAVPGEWSAGRAYGQGPSPGMEAVRPLTAVYPVTSRAKGCWFRMPSGCWGFLARPFSRSPSRGQLAATLVSAIAIRSRG